MVVGIDMFEDQGCSTRSTDGGVTWHARPLNKNGFSGEYMIRIVLVTEEADSNSLTFSHQDFPTLPAIDMCPKIRALPAIPNQSPRLIEDKATDTFVNGAMSVEIRFANGLQLSRLYHKSMNVSAIQQQTKESIFVLEIDGQCLTGSDFVLEGKAVLSADSEEVSVVYDISCTPAKLTGRLRITMDRSEELCLGHSIQNRSDKNQVVKVAFPVLGSIGWSEGFLKDRYLFLSRPALCSVIPGASAAATAVAEPIFRLWRAFVRRWEEACTFE